MTCIYTLIHPSIGTRHFQISSIGWMNVHRQYRMVSKQCAQLKTKFSAIVEVGICQDDGAHVVAPCNDLLVSVPATSVSDIGMYNIYMHITVCVIAACSDPVAHTRH